MVTIAPHNLVTWRGVLGTREMWQFSLHFRDGIGAANSIDTCNALHKAWADNIAPFTASYCQLTEVRISPIGENGSVSGEVNISNAAAKAGANTTPLHPYQTSLVVSLRSNKVTGKGSHGRFYLAAPAVGVGLDGAIQPGEIANLRPKVGTFLGQVRTTMAVQTGGSQNPILVSRGTTDYQQATRWAVGEYLDTVRSRRGGLIETRNYTGW